MGTTTKLKLKRLYEPLDEQRWVELDTETQRRELTFREEVRQQLEIEEDDESDSN